jgi:serine-type D-Ala-D-Ala carboxypeptidase/endopeptidase
VIFRHRMLAIAAAVLIPAVSLAQLPNDAEIRSILKERVDAARQSVGIIVGVVEPTERRVVAYGLSGKNDARSLDADTIFEIGSITKVFTSLLLADAVQRREVALSDTIAQYLPPQVRVPEQEGRSITLLTLSTHTSGLPREPLNLPGPPGPAYAAYSEDMLYQFLSGYQSPRTIGSDYLYSNLGAGLLGYVLTRRFGVDYETLVRSRITEPLGMRDTRVSVPAEIHARAATGHNRQLEPVASLQYSAVYLGAGSLHSTVNDMLTFLEAALGYRSSPLSGAFAAMAATRIETNNPGLKAGLGWAIQTEHGTEILWRNGGTPGFASWIGYEPRSRVGVIVLMNTFAEGGADDIGRHLINSKFPLKQSPAINEVTLEPSVLAKYVGQYQLAPDAMLAISRLNSRLFAQITRQPEIEIFASGPRSFFYKVVDAQLTFEQDAQGRVTAAVLHQNGVDQRAPRVNRQIANR